MPPISDHPHIQERGMFGSKELMQIEVAHGFGKTVIQKEGISG